MKHHIAENQLSLWDAPVQEAATPAPYVTLESTLSDLGFENSDIFGLMSLAEAEIERAMEQYPDCRYLIYGSFLTIKPLFEMPIKAYEVHCRELLRRIVFDEPLDLATDGEIMAFLLKVAFVIPLHNEPSALFSKLFRRAYPDLAFEGLEMLSERYAGETDNLYRDLQGRLTFKRCIPVERVPYQELLQIESDNGYPAGWADEQNVLQVRRSREANP